jgi:glycoside/pentoside/hexuronide:cation symporter, GPH family
MAIASPTLTRRPGLWPWAAFGAMLSAAGLPIYLHAPKFYVDTYGVSLATLGGVLAALRLIDVVQDPFLGWLAGVTQRYRSTMVPFAAAMMAAAMLGLFAIAPPISPIWWFALTLTVLFTAFSYLTIVFYANGVARALDLGSEGHLRLAGWRETGGLIGVCLAAVAPTALAQLMPNPYTGFALGFAAFAAVAVALMCHEWVDTSHTVPTAGLAGFGIALRDGPARNLLLVALFNGAPVAVTSTLFLYFVESRLAAPGYEGGFLLLFFLSAALSSFAWSKLAQTYGAKPVLLAAMALSIITFIFAATLGAGDLLGFAAICIVSGAALGADMTLLPAIFARRLAALDTKGGEAVAFGLWSFVSKLSLAIAAGTLLPILDASGFQSGQSNPESALQTLTILYALVPCALKLVAMAVLARTPTSKA